MRGRLGHDRTALGFGFAAGSFLTKDASLDGDGDPVTVPAARAGTKEHTLDRVRYRDLSLDLRTASAEARAWLDRARPVHAAGPALSRDGRERLSATVAQPGRGGPARVRPGRRGEGALSRTGRPAGVRFDGVFGVRRVFASCRSSAGAARTGDGSRGEGGAGRGSTGSTGGGGRPRRGRPRRIRTREGAVWQRPSAGAGAGARYDGRARGDPCGTWSSWWDSRVRWSAARP
ncbi:erythromycin esterase family protein [Streptomyces litmocidini]|uniref:erythromycin esterase family protein n=1 Tax=Streptomyces litmocidini TaxID=67318 RepID=UPI0027E51B3A|nr:erythromycin esterase family protein [Streptomyces litmocidini]